MKIHFDHEPQAETDFAFSVLEEDGPIRVQFKLNGSILWDHDCPDPPCHEIYRIPVEAAQGVFQMKVVNSIGYAEEMTLTVHGRTDNLLGA